MEKREGTSFCDFCGDERREGTLIAVVEKESDMQNLERTGAFRGLYHVLGGTLSPLDPDSPKKIHLRSLYDRVKRNLEAHGKCEVVLATNPTTEGDTTALYIEQVLLPFKNTHKEFSLSRLGRGLSLGSELEHVDESTLKSAFTNRK